MTFTLYDEFSGAGGSTEVCPVRRADAVRAVKAFFSLAEAPA